jgi:hypothetical protein
MKFLLLRFRSKSLFSSAPLIIGQSSSGEDISWSVILQDKCFSVVTTGFNPQVSVAWVWEMKKRVGLKVMNGDKVLIDKKLSEIVFPKKIPSNPRRYYDYNIFSPMDQFEYNFAFIDNISDNVLLAFGLVIFIFIGVILYFFVMFVCLIFKGIPNLYIRIKNYIINHVVINDNSIFFFVLFFMTLALFGYFNNIPLLAIFGGVLFLLSLFIWSLYRFDKLWHEYVDCKAFNELVIKINLLLLKIFKLNISQDKCYYWVHKFITMSGDTIRQANMNIADRFKE